MKIGIEAQRIFRKKKGGMDIVAIEIIRSLQQLDKENEYIIYAAPGEDTSVIEETSNFTVKLIRAFNYFDWEQIHLPQQVKRDKIDILHCTCNTAPLWSPVSKIVTIHDTIYLEKHKWPVNVNWYQRFGNYYRRLIVPRTIKSSKKIITSTEFEKKNLIKYFNLTSSKIEVIPNGVNVSFQKVNSIEMLERVRKKYLLPKRFIFYLGNTEPRKNMHNLLKAYSELVSKGEDVPDLVITNVSKAYLQAILNKIHQQVIERKITLLGYVDSNDLSALYSLADFFLYPSLREGFGLPILEAMACGTPVITSLTSSIPEIAKDAAFLVNPFKYKELANAMSILLANDDLKESYSRKGFERVKEYTWKAAAQKILTVYESLK